MRPQWIIYQLCRFLMVIILALVLIVYLSVLKSETGAARVSHEAKVRNKVELSQTTTTSIASDNVLKLDRNRLLNDEPLRKEDIVDGCACIDKDDPAHAYDFCYHKPENKSEHGLMMVNACKSLSSLKKLGLFDRTSGEYINLTHDELPVPVFITAFSANHYSEGRRLVTELQKYIPYAVIVVYDLGLSAEQASQVRGMCQTKYRKFNFNDWPANVRPLGTFRWKPIIIAQGLKEFGAVWYMDSSVKFKKGDLTHVYSLLKCRKKVPYRPPSFNRSHIYDDGVAIESGWHKDLWRDSIARCDKYAYMLQGWTGHGIYPATHPGVYKFLPTNKQAIQHVSAKMYEAGFVFVVRTREVIRDVLKWYVICALEPECMAPSGAHTGCRFSGGNRYNAPPSCHRYDQSVINLLLANVNNYDRYYWTSQIVDHFNIVRGAPSSNPKMCLTDQGERANNQTVQEQSSVNQNAAELL